jgi:predicted nucleotide-binding protein
LTKQKRKITTVASILTDDAVKDAFDRIAKELPNVTDMICIFYDRDGYVNWKTTNGTTLDCILAMLEKVKFAHLIDTGDDDG